MFKRRSDPNVITKKEECYKFYNSRKGEKITFSSFYQLYRKGGSMTMEEMIQPKKGGPKKKVYNGKWAEELKWYDSQHGPKAERDWFRNRLRDGYTKEEAILIGAPWEKARAKRKKRQPIVARPYMPIRPRTEKKESPDWFVINITYPKEVARVFRKEYVNMIEQLEWELTYTEEKTQICELNEKIERLNNELNIFNQYNH